MIYDSKIYVTILTAWALDFVRCIEEMPKWRKWIIRFVIGRYAAREYVGVREHLEKSGHDTQGGYGINNADYHNEKWSWIK